MLLAASLLGLAACSQQDDAPAPGGPSEQAGEPAAEAAWAEPPARSTSAEAAAGEAGSPSREVLGPAGIGGIVVGQAPPASLKTEGAQESDECRIYPDKALRIYAMTDGKVVARVTAMKGSKVQTAKGIAVGANEATVRKAYPEAAPSPHNSGLRFEIDGQGKVSAIHAGREPEIEYVEGCS